jgi:hypothetical protein
MKPTKKSLSELKEKIADQEKVKYAGNFDEFSHFIWWLESKLTGVELSLIINRAVIKQ